MTLFGTTFNLVKPYLDPTMGQYYIDELDLCTPMAPQPDAILDGVKYWNHKGFHDYNTAVTRTTLDVIENKLAEKGVKSGYPYPAMPIMPYATITFKGDSYYSIEAMMGFSKQVVRIMLDHANSLTTQQGEGKSVNYKIPCGVNQVMDDKGYWMHPDVKCSEGRLCPACKEILRLRNQLDDLQSDKLRSNLETLVAMGNSVEVVRELVKVLGPEEEARARIAAVVRDISAAKIPTQDPKYAVIGGKICNAETNQPIPDDEPIFILRAKDPRALETIEFHIAEYPYDNEHNQAMLQQAQRFLNFRTACPERMKHLAD